MSGRALTFLDTSVVVHAAGNIGYAWAVAVLRYGLAQPNDLVTDALNIQEVGDILSAVIHPRQATVAAQALQAAVQRVLPVTVEDLNRAHAIHKEGRELTPRESLHLAVMERAGVKKVCSVGESGYHTWPDVQILSLLERSIRMDDR